MVFGKIDDEATKIDAMENVALKANCIIRLIAKRRMYVSPVNNFLSVKSHLLHTLMWCIITYPQPSPKIKSPKLTKEYLYIQVH